MQRVVLSGQIFSLGRVLSAVPQGSVLGQLLFLKYVKDLSDGIKSVSKIFVDDTSLFLKCQDFKNLNKT